MFLANLPIARSAFARASIGIACAVLVPMGVLLMQQTYQITWLPTFPYGILGEVFPNPQWVFYGTLCSLLGCLGVWFALPPPWSADEAPAEEAGLRFTGRRPPLAMVEIVGAAGLYGWVIVSAAKHTGNPWLLLPFLAAIILTTSAIRTLTGMPDPDPLPAWAPIDYLFTVAAILAFTAFNQHDIRDWHFVFWGDEWPFYESARAVAQGAAVDPFSQAGVFGYHPIADSIYQGVVMRLTDMHALGWRLSSTLAAALPIIPLYALARRLGGAPYAGTAVVIYAACPDLWAFARIGYNNNDPLFFMAGAAALCYTGMQRNSAVLLFLAGACAAGAWYSLFTGRPMIGVIGLAVLLDWRGGWRTAARRLAFLLAGFTLVVLPLLVDNGDQTIRQMFLQTSLSPGRASAPVTDLLLQNTVRGVYAFLYANEVSHYVYGELFDVVSGGMLCIGVTLALRRMRHKGARLVVIWFVVGLLVTTPLNFVPEIPDTRLMIAVAPAALLAAWAVCASRAALARLLPRAQPLLGGLSVGAVLMVIVGLNLHQFYATMLPRRYAPYPTMDQIARVLLNSPHTIIVLPTNLQNIDPNQALCDIVNGYDVDPNAVLYPYPTNLRPYCSAANGAAPPPLAHVVVLRDVTGPDPDCAGVPGLRLNDLQGAAIVVYRLTVPTEKATYLATLTQRLLGACPRLMR
jgi:hypothetical protein